MLKRPSKKPKREPALKKHRPAIPDSVAWEAALRQGIACACGCGRMVYAHNCNKDHRPPLSDRPYDEKTRKYTPDANDPKFIEIMIDEHHDLRTFGKPSTTLGSDAHNRSHYSEVGRKHAAHMERMKNKTIKARGPVKAEDPDT